VWATIALLGWVPGGVQRSLVLESDFTVGNRSDDELRSWLDDAWAKNEDYTNVGWCDLCQGSTDPSCNGLAMYGCATAYLMSSSFASALSRVDVCMAADTFLLGSCWPLPGATSRPEWTQNITRDLGRAMTCSWQPQPAVDEQYGAQFVQEDGTTSARIVDRAAADCVDACVSCAGFVVFSNRT
jgi:hypothetical protein